MKLHRPEIENAGSPDSAVYVLISEIKPEYFQVWVGLRHWAHWMKVARCIGVDYLFTGEMKLYFATLEDARDMHQAFENEGSFTTA